MKIALIAINMKVVYAKPSKVALTQLTSVLLLEYLYESDHMIVYSLVDVEWFLCECSNPLWQGPHGQAVARS